MNESKHGSFPLISLSRRHFLYGAAVIAAALGNPLESVFDPLKDRWVSAATGIPGDPGNFFLDPSLLSTYPGDTQGPLAEQYLYQNSGSNTAIENPTSGGAPAYLTKRWADYTNWYSYRITIAASTPAPLYLTMITKGEVKLTVAGQVLLNTGSSGQGNYTAREFKLNDSSMWSNGYVEVRFDDADPSTGWGPNLYSLDLGPVSRWYNRHSHIHWDTTNVVWNLGYYDGYSSEFRGSTTEFTVGGDFSQLAASGTLLLRWSQSNIDSSKKYYFLAGVIGGSAAGNGTDTIDIGNNGSNEVSLTTTNARVYDVDITSYVQPTGNVVKISIPSAAVYDFFAVVEVSQTAVTPLNSLRVSFGGNEQAINFTKLINTSMYWLLEVENQANTGYIDPSLYNGEYWGTYFVADMGPAMTELFKWGFLDRARETLNYLQPDTSGTYSGHYGQDIAAGNLIFSTMANLMRADNLSSQDQSLYWTRLQNGMNTLVTLIGSNSFGLVYGTNVETSSDSLGIYVNSTSYAVLRNAADIANRLGNTSLRDRWNTAAQQLYNSINTHLRWSSNTTWLGQPMQAGTWMYGVNSDGSLPSSVHAAWHSVGSAKDAYEGLWADDIDFRDVSNATLDYHLQTFWSNWKTFGNNRGFGTDYGALSERGGWPLNSLLEADRMGDAKKNVEHVTFNSTDMNFAPFGPNQANTLWNYPVLTKLSPWNIIRETDATDKGNAPSVGNGETEDLNLVEYMLFLKNARIMAGVDDALYNGNNLVLIPRLPWGWTSLNVNNWPITYINGSSFARTTVSYSVQVQPAQVTMQVSAAASISNTRVRLGPFDPTVLGTGVTVNGSSVAFTQEVRGDASWLWISLTLSATAQIVASVSAPLQQEFYSFDNNSLSGFTSNGGTWSASGGHVVAQVGMNDGWNVNSNTISNGSVSADVKLDSGHAVGVALRSSADGTQGYALIIDQVDGLVKLARYPYTVLASASINVNFQRTYNLRLTSVGTSLSAYLNGVQVLTASDSTYSSGHYALFAYNSTGEFDNLLVKNAPILEQAFTGTSLNGWVTNGGTWSNPGGLLTVNTSGNAWCIAPSSGTNFIYSANVRLVSGNAVGISVRTNSNGGTQGYDLILDQIDGGVKFAIRPYAQLAFAPFTIVNNQTYNLRIVANGATLKGYINGQLMLTVSDTTYTTGNFGVFAYNSLGKFDDARAVAQ
jgi:hypothetical protein